jgi:hypothetical protein
MFVNLASPENKREVLEGESTCHLRHVIRGAGKVWDRLVDWNSRVGAGFDAAHSD